MAYTHICPAYNNTPNRQLPMGTSPHSPWLDRLRGSTHARVLLSFFCVCLVTHVFCSVVAGLRIESQHVHGRRAVHGEVDIVRDHLKRTTARDA